MSSLHDRDSHKSRIVGDSRRVGDAPDIGKVQKFRQGYDPISSSHRGVRRSRHASSERRRRQAIRSNLVLRRWLVLVLCLTAVSLSSVVVWTATADRRKPKKPTLTQNTSPDSTTTLNPPDLSTLEATTRAFLNAKTPEQLSPHILPTSVTAEEILDRLATSRETDGPVDEVNYVGPIQSLVAKPEAFVVTFRTTKNNRIALMAPNAEGKWLVDAEAYLRYCTPDWPTTLSKEQRPPESTVRIYLSPDNYYNGRYRDDKRWRAYAMASPDHEQLLVGYTPINSPTDVAIREAMENNAASSIAEGGRLLRMTLRIRHSPDSEDKQFEILEALADDWMIGAESLENFITRERR